MKIEICNWGKWQSYRSDRNQPPWIKVHRRILMNRKWTTLTDIQRGQLVVLWVIAADSNGIIKIPNGNRDLASVAAWVAKVGGMERTPDLQSFIDLGLIKCDANVTPERRQCDANVTPQTRLDETRQDGSKDPCQADPPDDIPYQKIINHLNEKSGKKYKATSAKNRKAIKARWNDGYRFDDFKTVIENRIAKWSDDEKMSEYLRPETLFSQKFEGYLNSGPAAHDTPADRYEAKRAMYAKMGITYQAPGDADNE